MLYYCTVCIWSQDKINLLVQQIMCEPNFADDWKQVQGLTSDKGWRVKPRHRTRLTSTCHNILRRLVRNSQAVSCSPGPRPGIMGRETDTHASTNGQRRPWQKNANNGVKSFLEMQLQFLQIWGCGLSPAKWKQYPWFFDLVVRWCTYTGTNITDKVRLTQHFNINQR